MPTINVDMPTLDFTEVETVAETVDTMTKVDTITDDEFSKALVVLPSHHDGSVVAADDDNDEAEVIDVGMTDVMEQRNMATKKPMHLYKINHIAVQREPVASSFVPLQNTSQASHSRSCEVKGAVERVYRVSSSSDSTISVLPIRDTFKPSPMATSTTEPVAKELMTESTMSAIAHASPSEPMAMATMSPSTGNQTTNIPINPDSSLPNTTPIFTT